MDQNGILLIVITVLVAFMAIGVWGILFALVRSRSRANDERNAAIRGITEECVEADRVLSSSAKTGMSVHTLKSALLPKIDKILKMLTANMHILDVYFVKYTESRVAAFQEALASSDASPLFPIDKFLAETKAPSKPSDTILVKGNAREEQAEPPAIDLRTGIITVSQEEPKQPKPAEKLRVNKPVAREVVSASFPPPSRKAPVQPPSKKPAEPVAAGEEEFDFEKEIAARVDSAIKADLGQGALDTKALHTEKTMRWDRDELKGLAGRPESIVVEGAERKTSAAAKPAVPPAAPKPEAKSDDAMISGEDIENTLDSFFGLDAN
jgi:hypothetical protein